MEMAFQEKRFSEGYLSENNYKGSHFIKNKIEWFKNDLFILKNLKYR